MATVRDYFSNDFQTMMLNTSQTFADEKGNRLYDFTARLHFDFDANAKYVSFYIPAAQGVDSPARLVMSELDNIVNRIGRSTVIAAGLGGSAYSNSSELVFTGRIFFYSESPETRENIEYLQAAGRPKGHFPVFRSVEYAKNRDADQRPRAFVSHDSRDKTDMAQPLVQSLGRRMCPVWYDEYSVKVGESLRESVEKGLKDCPKCVLLVTPNFLNNLGWGKAEFNAIFTREMMEKRNLILPVWKDVTAKQVYEYSPILADRRAIGWTDSETVAAQLASLLRE